MSLWIEWETEPAQAERDQIEALVTQAVEASLAEEQVETPVEVSMSIVSGETIQGMNREFRQMDRITDVLSFPLIEYEGKTAAEGVRQGEQNPDTQEVCLGDIVLCYTRAEEQAKEYGHSLQRELAFLTVHSMLHLLGYDHMEPEEEAVMLQKQKKILEGIGLPR